MAETPDGTEYAIVADDNYNFLDPYWVGMFEAPMFIFTPSGPPIAVGGSASAKKVAVGGKLGIVKDPFGKNGNPEYLGATLPLDGYGIINLSLSEDGKVLLGQLEGGYGTVNQNVQKEHQTHAWNVGALITAALNQPEKDRGIKHITLSKDTAQRIQTPPTAPVGTAFDPEDVEVNVEGRMGDVIGVNLREQAARTLLVREKVLSADAAKTPWHDLPSSTQVIILKRMQQLSDFSMQRYDLDTLSGLNKDRWDSSLELVVKKDKDGKTVTNGSGAATPVSRFFEDSTIEDDYQNSGVLFFAPKISDEEVKDLQLGKRLTDKNIGFFFSYVDNSGEKPESGKGYANVAAKDYTGGGIFFGDRPLDDPGYSAFKLKGSVGVGKDNDTLDVYRVEQRLRYLGFPTITTGKDNTIKNFDVDGTFGEKESKALKLFEKVIRYENSGVNARYAKDANGADGVVGPNDAPIIASDQTSTSLNWLSAYNAPHWMQLFPNRTGPLGQKYAERSASLPGWRSSQLGTREGDVEIFGTSWMRDLMRAKDFAPSGLVQASSLFNGAVDANHKLTPLPALLKDIQLMIWVWRLI